ncbi:terminase small subunit [Burkholderia phage DC1]|uniref:Terminase small subunit n=1 Tax=Burkholderia phage DC1 TaxID=2881398 RepID=I6NV32_9CAUD|nr:terminase small subunit [Burkholderia phage DC1]AEZ50846.1 terminase small subunit [Burkholderia phage DC1]
MSTDQKATSQSRHGAAEITPKQQAFVDEYLIDLNATKAAIRAGYSPKTAQEQSSRLLSKPHVQAAIAEAKARRAERTEIDQDRIVRELWNVLTADANGLIEYRRTCCRYCYGKDHRFQRTAGEMERAKIEHRAFVLKCKQEGVKLTVAEQTFDEQGGIGYDPRKPPVDDCPECFGEGYGDVFVKDTRNLSPELRSLYAGVKRTKEGIEVKMHDKQGFVQLLMRHAGMLNDKLKLQGDPENPIALLLKQVQGSALKPTAQPDDDEE